MPGAAPRMMFDPEKISVNTAWVKKYGLHFEVVVEPDAALEFRRTKGSSPDLKECLHAERIFTDAKRGLHAKDSDLEQVFGTSDALDIARKLILEGELQLTSEHRARIREQRRNSIINRIVTYAIDPTSGLPHPRRRIELALEEAKVRIDDNRDAEDQIAEIVRKLQPILPIRLETLTLEIRMPQPYGHKLYGDLQRFGQVKKADWLPDGGLICWLELPAGMQNDLLDELARRTHGAAEVKRVGERREYQ